jgi:thermitase
MRRTLSVSVAAVLVLAALPFVAASAASDRPRDDRQHVLVAFRKTASESEKKATHDRNGTTVEGRLEPERVEVVRIKRGDTVESALARYRSNPKVAWAEPNYQISVDAVPNDVSYPTMWGLDNTGQSGGTPDADIDAPEGWDLEGLALGAGAWPTSGFTVGVVDTGILATHEDLVGKAITPCYSALTGAGTLASGCNDDNGHGTHVSGTIAALANNGKGVAGVAFNAQVYMCKALDGGGSGWLSDVAGCINEIVAKRSVYNIRVVSMSLGGPSSSTLQAAVDNAYNNGVLPVAAAGNDSNSTVRYPAGYANAVSVAATDRYDNHASFSNTNTDVEVAAPGVSVLSTVPSGYASWSGTSMATPHAASVAAVISWKTGKTGSALRTALDAAVDDLGPAGRDTSFGFGRVNLCKALGSCAGTPSPTPTPTPTASPAPTPTPAPTPAANGTLRGTAYMNGSPKSGVTVSYTSGSVKTASNGTYSVSLAPATYTVSARKRSKVCHAGSPSGPTSTNASVTSNTATVVDWYC